MLAQTGSDALPATSTPILRVDTGLHAAAIRRVAVDETRQQLVTASDDKTARVWDLRTGKLLSVLRPPIGPNDQGRLYGVAIHPSLPLVAVGGISDPAHPKIYLFDLDSGRMQHSFDAGKGDIKRLAWSRDGSLLLAGFADWNGVRAFDVRGALRYEQGTAGSVYGIAVANNDRVAYTDFSGKVHLLRVGAEKVEALASLSVRARNPMSVAFDPQAHLLAVGYREHDTPVEVIEVDNGRVLRRVQPASALEGDFSAVAWSPDGKILFVAGTASRSGYRYPIWRFAADSGKAIDVVDVAGNSIMDLAALKEGKVVYGSFEASWGVLGRQMEVKVDPNVSDLRGASNLQVSGDARRVAWAFKFGSDRAHFDFARRVIQRSVPAGLKGAVLDRSGWNKRLQAGYEAQGEAKKRYTALVNGVTIKFDDVELASCGSYLRHGTDAILGTTKALYRLDEAGGAKWRLRTESEVTAVATSDDSNVIVVALADGILQWRRADTGAVLLSFFPARDGRWILWTPEGYFDASPGAERLVSWVVTRSLSQEAEAYPLARFRDQYRRPDIIDRVLESLDTRTAIEAAKPSTRLALFVPEAPTAEPAAEEYSRPATPAPSAAPASAPKLSPARPKVVAAPIAASPSPQQFPPLLLPAGPRSITAQSSTVELPFALRSPQPMLEHWLEVRVAGRPAKPRHLQFPERLDGQGKGVAVIEVVPGDSVVQLIAANKLGYSEPLTFEVKLPDARKAAPPSPPTSSPPAPRPSATPEPKLAEAGCPTNTSVAGISTQGASHKQPNLYIVAIGVSKYQRPEYELDFPAKDAGDFVRAMRKQAGRQYGAVSAHVLSNEHATREAVIHCLDWIATVTRQDDVAMVFFAGHGINEDSGQYYFLAHDADVDDIERTGVAETDLRGALKRIRGRTIFFVDTCYAGNAVGDPRIGRRALSRLADDLASAENGVIVFAGSSGRQESQESKDWGNGAFTKSLVEGLAGAADYNKAGHVTFKALDFFVSDAVSKLTKGAQTPVTITPIGVPDFVVALTRL